MENQKHNLLLLLYPLLAKNIQSDKLECFACKKDNIAYVLTPQ
jgi:hypothetical protein